MIKLGPLYGNDGFKKGFFNLQLFAKKEDEESQEEESQEEESQEEEIEAEEGETEAEEEESQEEEQKDTVPLKIFIEQKRTNKALKKRIAELESKTYDADINSIRESKTKEYLDLGIEETVAMKLAERDAEMYQLVNKKKEDSVTDLINAEIEDLKESDEFFLDVDTYRDEIHLKIKELKQKGIDISVEEAYVLCTKGTRNKVKNLNRNKTQREIIENKIKGMKKRTNVETSSGSASTNKYKLDKDDQKALEMLKQMQPNRKWTNKKYWESRYGDK